MFEDDATVFGARSTRVAQHAVRSDRDHAVGSKPGEQLREVGGVPGFRAMHRHGVGLHRQRERGLGPAGVRIAPGQDRTPPERVATLASERADRVRNGTAVASSDREKLRRGRVTPARQRRTGSAT